MASTATQIICRLCLNSLRFPYADKFSRHSTKIAWFMPEAYLPANISTEANPIEAVSSPAPSLSVRAKRSWRKCGTVMAESKMANMMINIARPSPSISVTLKQRLCALALGMALAMGASAVFAKNTGATAVNQPTGQEIGDKWTSSLEYQEYLRLGAEKSAEARALKERVITEITGQVLAAYIQSFDPKYRELMDKKVKELPLGLQTLLANIHIKISEKIKNDIDAATRGKVSYLIFQYVNSIYKNNETCITTTNQLLKTVPSLEGTEIMGLMKEIGGSYDAIARSESNIARSEANIARSEANIAAWDKIIKKLGALK